MRRVDATVLGVLVVAALSGSVVHQAGATRTLTLYALATQAQFADHSDDRARAVVKNPFNADTKAILRRSRENEKGKGPYPGDTALYRFKLYSDAGLKKRIGSAVYSCTFGFHRQAICEADYELTGGALYASGPAHFQSTRFTLAVSGGAGKYLGARGQVSSAPAGPNAHRLDFAFRK